MIRVGRGTVGHTLWPVNRSTSTDPARGLKKLGDPPCRSLWLWSAADTCGSEPRVVSAAGPGSLAAAIDPGRNLIEPADLEAWRLRMLALAGSVGRAGRRPRVRAGLRRIRTRPGRPRPARTAAVAVM